MPPTASKASPLPVSFEFFPPKTEEGREKLKAHAKALATLNPLYFSVTFGAGGSHQDKTLETVFDLQETTSTPLAPHISCVCTTQSTIRDLLNEYERHGIQRLIALRGDIPTGATAQGDFQYAIDLVRFIRENSGDLFRIDVAAYPEIHPQAKNAQADLENLKRKIDAGANGAITQYFYNVDAYEQFLNRCQQMGIQIPIVPGLMPIYNCIQLERFSDTCGAELPRWIRKKLEEIQDDEEQILQFGIDFLIEMCQKLQALGAPEIHFYTLNRSDIVLKIHEGIS